MSDFVIALDMLGADAGAARVAICPLVDLSGMVASWFAAGLAAPASSDDDIAAVWRDGLGRLAAACAARDLAAAVAACDDLDVRLAPVDVGGVLDPRVLIRAGADAVGPA